MSLLTIMSTNRRLLAVKGNHSSWMKPSFYKDETLFQHYVAQNIPRLCTENTENFIAFTSTKTHLKNALVFPRIHFLVFTEIFLALWLPVYFLVKGCPEIVSFLIFCFYSIDICFF